VCAEATVSEEPKKIKKLLDKLPNLWYNKDVR
jgi:hypothetical protein